MDKTLTESEDKIAKWLESSTPLDRLVMIKHLRLFNPHQSTSLQDLEHAIRRELIKVAK